MHMHDNIYTHVHTQQHSSYNIYACTCIYIHTYIHTQQYIRVCMHNMHNMHIHMHMNTHTHTHMPICRSMQRSVDFLCTQPLHTSPNEGAFMGKFRTMSMPILIYVCMHVYARIYIYIYNIIWMSVHCMSIVCMYMYIYIHIYMYVRVYS